jgi:hypothetical protein
MSIPSGKITIRGRLREDQIKDSIKCSHRTATYLGNACVLENSCRETALIVLEIDDHEYGVCEEHAFVLAENYGLFRFDEEQR